MKWEHGWEHGEGAGKPDPSRPAQQLPQKADAQKISSEIISERRDPNPHVTRGSLNRATTAP